MADSAPAGSGLWRWLLGGLAAGAVLLGLLIGAYAVGRHQRGTAPVAAPTTRTAAAPARTTTGGGRAGSAAVASVAAGKATFESTCGGCHLQGGAAAGVGPKLQGLGLSTERITSQIKNGGGAMPGNLVTGADLKNVVAYVLSIQR